jgi:hypothetical protein
MIAPGKNLNIHVNIKGNGDSQAEAGTGLSITHKAYSVGVLWQTYYDSGSNRGLITLSNFDESSQTVKITANDSQSGNAVIAAYDSDGSTILWSWHIWVSNYNPNTTPVDNGAIYPITNSVNAPYTFMDRNLGATSATPGDAGTIGLHYQWGRKDPFTASSSFSSQTEINVYDDSGNSFTLLSKEQTVGASNNLENSIENPDVFYENGILPCDWYTTSSSSQNNALWGGENLTTPSDKTIFDPCPAGWRVPAFKGGQSPWSALGDNDSSTSSVGTWENYGVTWTAITAGYWSAAGSRDFRTGSSIHNAGSGGGYWSASPNSYNGYRLDFGSSLLSPSCGYVRAYGFSVRCVQE